MRLLEIEIQNVRGIRHLALKPNGDNFLVYGPNGCGKSAVVDSIDFLLTGRISRLTGKGTGGISLQEHGSHIDCEPTEAVVRALVQAPGVGAGVEIKRCVADPDTLQCDPGVADRLEQITRLARRGQHVLTRLDILRYITAEPGARARRIQQLLNLSGVEDVRTSLVKARNRLEGELKEAKRSVRSAKAAVNATLHEETYRQDAVLEAVNHNRATLGAEPIGALESSELKVGLGPLTGVVRHEGLNVKLVAGDADNLRKARSEQYEAEIGATDDKLRALIGKIRSDARLSRVLSLRKLTELGIELIDETGKCPLCDTSWPPGVLRENLEKRLAKAKVAAELGERVNDLADAIAGSADSLLASLQRLVKAAEVLNLENVLVTLESWVGDLKTLSRALDAPIDEYAVCPFDADQVRRMLAPGTLDEDLERLESVARERFPGATAEQDAWDTLTLLEENLKRLEKAQSELDAARASYGRARVLHEAFLAARDAVLGRLYDSIRDRFVTLYQQLHLDDEGDFTADLEAEGPSLHLQVGFYGRGRHPPHALHSEGHQDSMGLCLYLALAEQLTEGKIDLVILDDVVMSIDTDHRRQMCGLLASSLGSRQLLITTHDKTWANELRSQGVVGSRGMVEFYNWHVETGPVVNCEVDMWERIEQDLDRNDISTAALRLRRGSEHFFSMVCDALQARVRYRSDGRLELGDFLPAAMGKFRSLLRQAKNSAQSWGDQDRFEMLQEQDSVVGQIYARSYAEQWAVNANVHYNNWRNFSRKDLRPVVEAFQDLSALFVCSQCGGMLRVASERRKPVSVRCKCAKVNWNLIPRGKGD